MELWLDQQGEWRELNLASCWLGDGATICGIREGLAPGESCTRSHPKALSSLMKTDGHHGGTDISVHAIREVIQVIKSIDMT